MFAVATASSLAGLLALPIPAEAGPMAPLAPACNQYFFTGNFSWHEPLWKGFVDALGPTVDGNVIGVNDDNVTKDRGTVSGGIQGRTVDFTIHWGDGGPLRYTGTVSDDGLVHGGVRGSGGGHWDSLYPLNCSQPAAPPTPANPQVVLAPGVTDPRPHEVKPQDTIAVKPPQGPGVSFSPRFGGLTAHITDRSGVDSHCTYKSEGFQSTFFLPANSTYDLAIVPAIPTFQNHNVTITCDNGTSTNTSTFF